MSSQLVEVYIMIEIQTGHSDYAKREEKTMNLLLAGFIRTESLLQLVRI